MCCVYVHCNKPNSGKHPTVTAASRLRWNHLPTTSAGFPSAGFVWYPRILMAYYHLLSCSILSDLFWAWKMIYMALPHFQTNPHGAIFVTGMSWLQRAPQRSGSPEGDLPPCEADCDLSTLGPNQTAMVRAMMVCPQDTQPGCGQWRDKVRAESTPIYEFL